MIGVILVSHSEKLTEGVKEMIEEIKEASEKI